MKDLTKKKLDKLSKALEATQVAFRAEVDKLAEQARAEILPYFEQHDYGFMAGNGTWFVSKTEADDEDFYREDNYVTDDELPANIRKLLWLEVGRGDHLGFYIRDIKRGEW